MSADDFASMPFPGRGREVAGTVVEVDKTPRAGAPHGTAVVEVSARPKHMPMARPSKDDPVAVAAAALEKVPYERLAEFWVLVSPEKKRGIEIMGFK